MRADRAGACHGQGYPTDDRVLVCCVAHMRFDLDTYSICDGDPGG
jgi:hypothetical protein